MRLSMPLALSLCTSALFGCAQSPTSGGPAPTATAERPAAKTEATAAPVKPLDKKTFGAAITEKTTVPLVKLLAEPAKFSSQTVRTEGKVTAVCKSMGCWICLLY